jgi:hypothetical protein
MRRRFYEENTMAQAGKEHVLELIKQHKAATETLHAQLRKHVEPQNAAKLDAALAKHKDAQQGLEDDAQGVLWVQ